MMIRRNLANRAVKKTAPVKDGFSKYMNQPEEDIELPFITLPQDKTYTKTEINRMSTAELKTLAKQRGISGAFDMTGSELKKVLIQNLGL